MARPGRAFREIALYGVCGGLLIAVLRLVEYRFLVLQHSVEIYGAIVAAFFAGFSSEGMIQQESRENHPKG